MNTLRRLVFPVLVALLALAIGIALGSGPLQDDGSGQDTAALSRDNTALQDKITSLRAADVFDQSLNDSMQPKLLDGRLDGRSITLVVLPGVTDATVSATQQALKLAGATVAVQARVAPALLDPGRKTYVDSVAANSIKDVSDLSALADAPTYERAAALFARAYTGHGDQTSIDDDAATIDSELQGAKLVAISGEPSRRGDFAVVLAPGTHGTDSYTTATMVIAHNLVTALVKRSDAVVVGSTPSSSAPGGLVTVLAADDALASKRLSTVNVVDSAAGETALVYALAAAAAGDPGHFGVEDGEAVLPPGLAPKTD